MDNYNYEIGDLITIETENTNYTGNIMPSLNNNIIVIKMKSGYNAGINKNKIKSIKLIQKGEKPKHSKLKLNLEKNPNLKNISILSTGGTVASRVDYNTGAVHPAFTAEDLITSVPELLNIANINGKVVLNILSENMTPEYWKKIANEIENEVKNNNVDGIVIAHGTDTMHYSSAALSFMMDTNIPIIFVGAQRSSDRPSSDAALNLISATKFAAEPIKGVFVVMHGESGDNYCYLHYGTKVRKSHTTRRDAFKSINTIPVGKINLSNLKIDYLINDKEIININNEEKYININTNLEEKVTLLKIYPGINGEIINYFVDTGYKGIVIEGTGLGHAPETIFENIKYAVDNGVVVVMTSQTINGRVNMNVYSNGVELQKLGVISCEDIIPEVALVKLMYLLGNYSVEETKKLINKNLKGEISKISRFDSY